MEGGTLAPKVTPLVRIPPNGGEMNQWIAKQVLDIGVFGIIFPHVSTVDEARNAVSACRYPRLPTSPMYAPPASVAMPRFVQRGTGGSHSRSIMPGPTSGPLRPRVKSWRSFNVKRCVRSIISPVSCRRCPASAWS
jgi:hypothetical protein